MIYGHGRLPGSAAPRWRYAPRGHIASIARPPRLHARLPSARQSTSSQRYFNEWACIPPVASIALCTHAYQHISILALYLIIVCVREACSCSRVACCTAPPVPSTAVPIGASKSRVSALNATVFLPVWMLDSLYGGLGRTIPLPLVKYCREQTCGDARRTMDMIGTHRSCPLANESNPLVISLNHQRAGGPSTVSKPAFSLRLTCRGCLCLRMVWSHQVSESGSIQCRLCMASLYLW